MDEFDVDLEETGQKVELKDDETVLVVDRSGREIEVRHYGPVQVSARGERVRHKVLVDECAHNGTDAKRVKRHDYGTSYCPLCDGSRGPDGLWRVLEVVPR